MEKFNIPSVNGGRSPLLMPLSTYPGFFSALPRDKLLAAYPRDAMNKLKYLI